MTSNKSISEVESLQKVNFFLGDELASFIIEKKGWGPLQVALFSYISIVISIVIALISGRLFPDPNYLALFEDFLYWAAAVFVLPLSWGYYVWSCVAPTKVLAEIQASGAVTLEEKDIRIASNILENKYATILAWFLSLSLASLGSYQDFIAPPRWTNGNIFVLVVRVLYTAPTTFAALSAIFRTVSNAKFFREILRNVTLNPLHPDRAGGLRKLGQYALSTTYPIALAGVIAVISEYFAYLNDTLATSYYLHVILILYIPFSLLTFFAPLSAAHDAMIKAKERLILKISYQFNMDFSLTFNELTQPAKALKDNIEKIEQLQRLHKLAETFPVWPFDIQTIRKFLIAISSPITSIIIAIIIQKLTSD